MNKFAEIILAILIFNSFVIAQEHCGDFLSPFIQGTSADRLLKITELHAKGIQAIPMLLPEIHNRGITLLALENPYLSYYESHTTYCGVVAAYLIELILARSSLPSHSAFDGKSEFYFIEFEYADYLAPLGFIAEIRSKKAINEKDLSQIARLYSEWWKANEGKSLDALREDWNLKKRPLTGSRYIWR